MSQPDAAQTAFAWLLALSQYTNNNFTGSEDVRERLEIWSVAAAADLPPRAFKQNTLDVARRHFDVFPSYAGMFKFLADWLSEHPAYDPRYYAPHTAAEIALLLPPNDVRRPADYEAWRSAKAVGRVHGPPFEGDPTPTVYVSEITPPKSDTANL